jgi:hypothetical protein
MKLTCTYCGGIVRQDRNSDGLNYCTNCGKLFLVTTESRVPLWIFGVLVFLVAYCQLRFHL